jgi:ankyrin repeat protein
MLAKINSDCFTDLLCDAILILLVCIQGETALHIASQRGLVRLVKALLDNGANANAQTQIPADGCSTFKQTPMHLAVLAAHTEVVKILLDFKGTKSYSCDHGHFLASMFYDSFF